MTSVTRGSTISMSAKTTMNQSTARHVIKHSLLSSIWLKRICFSYKVSLLEFAGGAIMTKRVGQTGGLGSLHSLGDRLRVLFKSSHISYGEIK